MDEFELYVGLAEAFGKLKTKEAIPFLIKNISLQRGTPSPNIWMKAPRAIELRLPAVFALIQIGPEASKMLIRAPREELMDEDRLAAIFVVSRIPGVPEAREFVASAFGDPNGEYHWEYERYWVKECLKVIDGRR